MTFPVEKNYLDGKIFHYLKGQEVYDWFKMKNSDKLVNFKQIL